MPDDDSLLRHGDVPWLHRIPLFANVGAPAAHASIMTAPGRERLFLACQIRSDGALVDAMRSLERSNTQICLVINDGGQMLGTLTDGDIRRALLAGAQLNSPLAPHVVRDFISIAPGTSRADVLELMQARSVRQIPIVDPETKRVLGLHLLEELIGSSERPNWAVIMAGGRGTRLGALTADVPKPMLQVAGRPILERLVLHLMSAGIRRIYLAVNYLSHIVENHFGNGDRFGCRIEYLREDRPLGSGGALSLLPERPTDPVIAMNGDLVVQFDVGRLLAFHEQGKFAVTVTLHEHTHTVPLGVVETTDNRVLGIREKPTFSWRTNAGIYVLGPDIPARVPPQTDFPLPALVDQCIERGEAVGAYPIDGEWIDVGRVQELRRARGESGS
jgi:dTDP-glucose pyrophosphorylase